VSYVICIHMMCVSCDVGYVSVVYSRHEVCGM